MSAGAEMKVHGFWRSSAAYRLRLGLAWKGLAPEAAAYSLTEGEHARETYRALNPQGFVPALEVGGDVLTQSLAILEYLDETHPEPPLLPRDPIGRAQVRAMALVVACDIHPLNNLRVLKYLRGPLGHDEATTTNWIRHWIGSGFEALEVLAKRHSADGAHCYGRSVTLADLCLVPQMYNARRFGCELAAYPTVVGIDARLRELPVFAAAAPEQQPDAAV